MTWWLLPASRSSMHSWVKSAYGIGAVSKLQGCWTKNARFVVLVSHVQQFKEHRNQFCQYPPIHGSYSMHRCIESEIWWFSWWWRRQTTINKTNCFTPYACVRGNYQVNMYLPYSARVYVMLITLLLRILVIVVVVDTKFARSQDLGTWVMHKHSKSIKFGRMSGFSMLWIQ